MSAAIDEVVRRQAAATELLRRRRCRTSLHSYALNIDIPLAPFQATYPDETLLGPARHFMPVHIAKILEVLERTANRYMGRCMIFAPPGSAKSAYVSVVTPTWEMGRKPKSRGILTSYAEDLAHAQSRRQQLIVEQENYRQIFDVGMGPMKGVGNWNLQNESELFAAGLLGGITGNRATFAIIDDPVAGRAEADSPKEQVRTYNAYSADLKTRLMPGAWIAFIMTRWNENDLAGKILPDDYKGQSGMIKCKDGLMWEVLNIPAKAEHPDDPLGRKLGEYLYPEWFTPEHWAMFENAEGPEAARDWASLFQQRPTAQGNGRFTREMFNLYDAKELPEHLTTVGASDHAVTQNGGDWSEAGVWGLDARGHLWLLDWWSKQTGDTGEAIDQILDMVKRWKARMWFNEGGVIDKAISGAFIRRSQERIKAGEDVFTDRRALPSMADKVAKCMSFQARCAIGTVHLPRRHPVTEQIIMQLLALPAGRYDDKADVCGLIGRAIDQYHPARPPEPKETEHLQPFTGRWLEFEEPKEPETVWR